MEDYLKKFDEKVNSMYEDTEKCVICGKETYIPANLDISSRQHYIPGSGQLCEDCYNELFKKQFKKEIEYEMCAICGTNTHIPKNQPIETRPNYIEGIGQLCRDCYNESHNTYLVNSELEKVDENYFKEQIEKYRNTINYQEKRGYELFKRIIDIIFCLVAFIPATLLILIFSILIVIESPGSPIFKQVRVGKDGKLITIHKLRSMRKDAEAHGQKWTSKDDKRITKVGSIIRKVRIDELPQLFDVLVGKMSLIGPRPEIPSLTKLFNEQYPGFVTRLLVTPGMSGLAQVRGGYEATPDEKLADDKEYIENRGIKLYIKIFYMTIKTVVGAENAR